MSNTSTILWAFGSFQRVVRSQRIYKGVRIGAIRDKGYLVLVRFDGNQETMSGCWSMIRTIRKLA
jgi:hypothetical protein